MRSQHDGMSLWYGTPDAPAPEGDIQHGTDLTITIGVQPIDASNRVELLYCLNHGPVQAIDVHWLRNDLSQRVQYFRTRFPDFRSGDVIEYTVACHCAGRQVPPAEEAESFPSSFRVVAAESHVSTTAAFVAHEAPVIPTEETHGTVPKAPGLVVSTPLYTKDVGEPTYQPQPAISSSGAVKEQEPTLPTLEQLNTTLNLGLSQKLLHHLKANDILTLEDVRTQSGFPHIDGIPIAADDPSAGVLKAHSQLSVLPSDAAMNAQLIAAHYESLQDIATAPLDTFVATVGPRIGSDRAEKLHTAATAQSRFLANVLTDLRVNANNGLSEGSLAPLTSLETQVCGCKDCQNAASPLAYLVDLLDYAVRHLKSNGKAITLQFLEERFHQPFSRLPATCEAMEQQVRQVRICIEVLRKHLPQKYANYVPSWYLETAYSMLLEQIGTSFAELRRVLSSKDWHDWKALADRLGMSMDPNPKNQNPEPLDRLFLATKEIINQNPKADPQPKELTEQYLEWLFGLPDTTRDPLAVLYDPDFLTWRQKYLLDQWAQEDWPQDPLPVDTPPLIDPDVIDTFDIQLGSPAVALLNARDHDLNQKRYDMEVARKQYGFEVLITDLAWIGDRWVSPYGGRGLLGLGIDISQFKQLIASRRNGENMQNMLDAVGLSEEGFDYLATMWEVFQQDPKAIVLQSEWENVYSILIARLKRKYLFKEWRDEEQKKGITLSPYYFCLRPSPLAGGTEKMLNPWRASEAVRRQWVNKLEARIEQQQVVIKSIQELSSPVEEELLVKLRTELLLLVTVPGVSNLLERWKWLARHLQIDVEADICQMTTRIAQATETIQGVLFGARNSLLEDTSLTLDDPYFEQQWQWLGSYATWRSAMLVFFYPENVIRPSWHDKRSPAFDALVEHFKKQGHVTREDVLNDIKEYEEYFADISSLKRAAICQTQKLLHEGAGSDDVVVVASGGRSGKFYSSSWKRLPGWGLSGSPEQAFWSPVTGFENANEIVGIFPYQRPSGETHLALYSRGIQAGINKLFFNSYDGRSWEDARELSELPGVICSAEYDAGIIPASPPFASAGGQPWILHSGDEIVALDIDGDGRTEILVFAGSIETNGMRRIGLLREYAAGLVLSWAGFIDNTWHVPDIKRPVILPIRVPPYPQRLLVVSSSIPQQIGIMGWQNGAFNVLWRASEVSGANGSWPVRLGAEDDPTVFVDANLDGSRKRLLVFEHAPSGVEWSPVKTTVHVLNWLLDAFAYQVSYELKLPAANPEPEHGDSTGAKWGRFIPVRKGAIDDPAEDILILAQRNEWIWDRHGHLVMEPHVHLQLLRWENNGFLGYSNNTVFPPSTYFDQKVPGVDASKGDWTLNGDEEFFAFNNRTWPWPQDILVRSPSQNAVAVFTYASEDGLGVAWQKNGSIDSEVPFGQKWYLDARDELAYVRSTGADGNDVMRAAIIRPDVGSIGILALHADRSLFVRWIAAGRRVQPPGPKGAEGWLITPNTHYITADIDADRHEECIVLASDQAGNARCGILRELPGSIYPALQGLSERFGPTNVTVLSLQDFSTEAERDARRTQIEMTYNANTIPSPQAGKRTYIQQQTIYLDEAYYFVPMEIALRLNASGDFISALDWFRSVYDWSAKERKIAYKLVLNGQPDFTFERSREWLRNPLNPHALAEARRDSYTRFTILSIVRCLVDYADAEFTRATAESVPRARQLYMEALDLLDAPELQQHATDCSDLIGMLTMQIGEDEDGGIVNSIQQALRSIESRQKLQEAVEKIRGVLLSDDALPARFSAAQKIIVEAKYEKVATFAGLLAQSAASRQIATSAMIANPAIARMLEQLGTSSNGKGLTSGPLPQTVPEPNSELLVDRGAPTIGNGGIHSFDEVPWHISREFIPAPNFPFCIPPNPVVATVRSHAELCLNKIRSCRNIAGMGLRLDPYTVPISSEGALQMFGSGDQVPSFRSPDLHPLPYRYTTLIERTKQLVDLARQMEQSLLSSIQSTDQARYEQLKASQDLALAQAGVHLKDMQLVQATDGVASAELQRGRATLQFQHYTDLLKNSLSEAEKRALDGLFAAAGFYQTAAAAQSFSPAGWTGGIGSTQAQAISTLSQYNTTKASYERRKQDWQLLQQLSAQDVLSGQQQILLARDQVQTAAQEQAISTLQANHAEEILDFLTTKKFGNATLYEWMSDVLEQVYRSSLQQATAMAQLAQAQLAFERQELPPAFIRPDYWTPPSKELTVDFNLPSNDGQIDSVRGLTGSARLLRDISELDQYAFRTNQRKLQLSKTLSLAQLDPFAFQRFRETGVLLFATPMSLFDHDFPGHYLRLIKRVRTSVVALIPPIQGIRATLGTTGTSSVVIGHDRFQKVVIQRGPELVALSSPMNATGLFELDPQPELLVPFEGIGVDTTWEFSMPKAANQFDYRSIADVLITIEYTALNSFDYHQEVLQTLDSQVSADRAFSFRSQFADAWYDLHNPEPVEAYRQMVVSFETKREDFPPNIEDLSISHIVLYFAHNGDVPFKPVEVTYLLLERKDGGGPLSSDGDGIISTRRANAAVWQNSKNSLIAKLPIGTWELSLNYKDFLKDQDIRERFKREEIEDILFVITYTGRTSKWV
jgi:hypothetical protein